MTDKIDLSKRYLIMTAFQGEISATSASGEKFVIDQAKKRQENVYINNLALYDTKTRTLQLIKGNATPFKRKLDVIHPDWKKGRVLEI